MEIDIKGYKVLIDDEDYEKISQIEWRLSKKNIPLGLFYFVKGYRINGKFIEMRLHRIVMGCQYGDGKFVDHINGNTLDNRKCNLRICSHADNIKNQKIHSNNKSGYKGVSWDIKSMKWHSRITYNKLCVSLGFFNTPQEAYAAYCEAARKYHGEFARFE